MNATQIKHAKQRAENIKDKRAKIIRDKYSALVKRLSDEEKLKAIKANKFTVKKSSPYSYWYNYISFNDEIEFDQQSYEKEVGILINEYDQLIDELVLGDCERALELLKEFEKKV